MTTALAAGMSPERLAPGDPDGARALAARLDGYAEGAGAAGARLAALESGTWVGEAAEAFRSSLDQLPQRLRRASAAFAEAASALRAYAAAAEEARERAALALARFDDALITTARWEYQRADHDAAVAAEASGGPLAGPGPSGHDPGADARRAAERLAEEVQTDLEAAERTVEQRLRQAAADAPDEPGFWDQAFRLGKEFLGGAVEATVDLGEFAFKLSPTYALIDPEGYVEHAVGLGQGIAYGVTHPVEFAQAVTNWEMWLDNPARALGQLVPDLALAVATAGSGVAATGAARAARGVDNVADMALMRGMPAYRRRIEAGNRFNRRQASSQPHREVYVAKPSGSGYHRLDGYNPRNKEIVSRKHTQLAELQPRTAMGYLREVPGKYAPGTPIADVPSTPSALRGQELRGDMILEVPPQRRPVPQAVLDEASRLGVTIRETTPPAWQRGAVGAGAATGVETAVSAAEVAR